MPCPSKEQRLASKQAQFLAFEKGQRLELEKGRYTFFGARILKSYQAIYFLRIKDPEVMPGNILSLDQVPRNEYLKF